jgi:hypothetical protein
MQSGRAEYCVHALGQSQAEFSSSNIHAFLPGSRDHEGLITQFFLTAPSNKWGLKAFPGTLRLA